MTEMAKTPAQRRIDPIGHAPIVENDKRATNFFANQWDRLVAYVYELAAIERNIDGLDEQVAALQATEIGGDGTYITPAPAPLSDGNITFTLSNSGATPGTYGSATQVAQVTIDAKGRVTAVSNVAISGGGGTSLDVEDDGVTIETSVGVINFTGAGVTVTSPSAGQVDVAIPGGGGGGGGAYFNGFSGNVGSLNGAGSAMKGMIITPDVNIDVSHVCGFVDGASAGLAHAGIIAEMTGTTASDTVVSVVGTTSSVNTVSTNLEPYRYPFASPVSLTAGTPYFIGIINQSSSGVTAVRLGSSSGSSSQAGVNNHPGDTTYSQVFFSSLTLSPGDPITSYTSGGYFTVWIDGYTA